MMDHDTLNERLTEIADMGIEYPVKGLEGTGKALPYYGWYWRDVFDMGDDADIDLRVAHGRVWIVQNDKWGLGVVRTTKGQRVALYAMLGAIAENPILERLQAFYDHLQTFLPEGVTPPGSDNVSSNPALYRILKALGGEA